MTTQAATWFMCRINADQFDRDMLSYTLFELGAGGIEEREQWYIAYFETNDKTRLSTSLVHALQKISTSASIGAIEIEAVAEQDWHTGWRKFFKPIFVDDVFCVRPPWESISRYVAHEIVIEPKQAFGTGNHATTWLMLQAIAHHPNLPQSALDVGTGSGILAIAHALKQPESQIIGVEIDGIALENARENVELNVPGAAIRFIEGELAEVEPGTFPVIYANMQCFIIEPILDQFAQRLRENGIIFFSGILESERERFSQALIQHNFKINNISRREEWLRFDVMKG